MSDKPNLSSSVEDCPPEEKGSKGKKGPIVRMEEHVKRLQEAAGLEGDDIDGMLGPQSSAAIAEKLMGSPEALKALPADIRESIEAIEKKLGRGMFLQHIKDPGECKVDGSDSLGLLHSDGKPEMHRDDPAPDTVAPPLARPKYNEDGTKFGTDPLFDKIEDILRKNKENPDIDPGFSKPVAPSTMQASDDPGYTKQDGLGVILVTPRKQDGLYGSGLTTHEMAPNFPRHGEIQPAPGFSEPDTSQLPEGRIRTPDPETQRAFEDIQNYNGDGQGRMIRLDQIDPGTPEMKTLDQIEVGPATIVPLGAQVAQAEPSVFQGVQDVAYGVAGKLTEMFFTADKNTGAPLDNPGQEPAMAANYTHKPAGLSMTA